MRDSAKLFLSMAVLLFSGVTLKADTSSTAATDCTRVAKVSSSCTNAQYPDVVQCGDFKGYMNLSKYPQFAATAVGGSISLPNSVSLYAVAVCDGDAASEELKQCYYDNQTHTQQQGNLQMADDESNYVTSQNEDISEYAVTSGNKCQKAGIPVANSNGKQNFCAALVTCRGQQTQFKVCRATGPTTCPTADQCNSDLPSGSLTVKTDTGVNPKQTLAQIEDDNGKKVSGLKFLMTGQGSARMNYSLDPDSNTLPVVVSDGQGHSQCFEFLDTFVGNAQVSLYPGTEPRSSQASGGKCPNINSLVNDPCVATVANPIVDGESGGANSPDTNDNNGTH